MWRRFSHPNIVPFLGVSNLFQLCLVSEWMRHGSIRSFVSLHPDHDRIPWVRLSHGSVIILLEC